MRHFGLLILNAVISSAAIASCPELSLPQRVAMEETKENGGRDFKIKSEGKTIAIISMRNPTERFTFDLKTKNKELIARAYETRKGDDLKLEIRDCENRSIGVIKAKTFRNTFALNKAYTILDGYERDIGSATKNQLMATQYDVVNNAGQKTMRIHNSALDLFGDSWTIDFYSQEMDPRVTLMLPAYKTSSDVRQEKLEERREKIEDRKEDREEEREDAREDRKERRKKEEKRRKEKEKKEKKKRNQD